MIPRRLLTFTTWLGALCAGWMVTWVCHDLLRDGMLPSLRGGTRDTVFWTVAKVIVWFGSAAWFLLRDARPEDPLGWLGFRGAASAPLALGATSAWLLVQIARDVAGSTLPLAAPVDAALLNALVIAPLFEETLFRGFGLAYLVGGGIRPAVAVGLTALAWGLLHVPGWLALNVPVAEIVSRFTGIALFGLVLGGLRLRSRSLFVPIVVHVVNNAWHEGLGTRLVALLGR